VRSYVQRLAAKRPRLSSDLLEPLVRQGRRASLEAAPTPGYSTVVSIELPGSVEEQLRSLAAKQGRDVRTLVEEAVRQYLESASITDLDALQIAEAQAALLGELPALSDWKADDA